MKGGVPRSCHMSCPKFHPRSCPGGEGTPVPARGVPPLFLLGEPNLGQGYLLGQDRGTPQGVPSLARTGRSPSQDKGYLTTAENQGGCVACGMPLVFTLEDFLVNHAITVANNSGGFRISQTGGFNPKCGVSTYYFG